VQSWKIAASIAAMAVMQSMDARADKHPPTKPDARVLRTLTETNGYALGRPSHVRMVPDGSAVVFLRSSGPRDRNASVYELDVGSKTERLLVSPDQILRGEEEKLSTEEKAARERKRISTGGFTGFDLAQNGERVLLKLSGKVYLLERKTKRLAELPIPDGVVLDPRLSPAGDRLAFVRDNDLFVMELPEPFFELDPKALRARASITQLTTGGSEDISHGLAEFVAQEEMNRFVGYWWSPDGTRVAYQTNDQSKLERLTIADASHPERAAHSFHYPRAGKTNVDVKLSIVTVDGKTRTEVHWDRAQYPYLARVLWQRNAPLSVLVQSRDQRKELFLRVDSQNGRTSTLHQEEDADWLNLSTTLPRWMPDGFSYLWATERTGGWTIERHWPAGKPGGAQGRHVETILDQSAGFSSLVHVDDQRKVIWFLGGPNPTETHLYRSALDGSKPPEQISDKGADHDAVFSTDGTAYVLTRTTLTAMTEARLHKIDDSHRAGVELKSVALEPDFLPNVELVPADLAGGFCAAIIRPHGFDRTKKYPVVLHVYGGPGYSMVRSAMPGYFLPQWIADHGFVVVSIDGRGTPRRGRAFERAIKHRFGSVPLDDQITGLVALASSHPELDLSRVGAYGWSFGGFMAALSVLRRPDVFKVAVAGAPVVDWLYYDTHYTERYLGLPDVDRDAYTDSSLLTYAPKLERPLLLVHGIADDNVYFAHTLQLADALFRSEKSFELLPLVGLTHQVGDPHVREALHVRIVSFLGEALW
jgi:dipeptidyl-peptidase-4